MGNTSSMGHAKFGEKIYEIKKIKNIIKYHHKTCFSPVQFTWIQKIADNFLMLRPCLARQQVLRHLEKSEATVKGHMKQQRQNVRSTTKNENTEKPKNKEYK